MNKLQLNQQNPMVAFARITKVDEARRIVSGRAVQEIPDRSGERFNYEKSKPYFLAWSKSQLEASLGKSAGNVRGMHSKIAAGVLLPSGGMLLNDVERAIDISTHVTDDQEWRKVMTGTYTGFSIGGKYVDKSEPDADGIVDYVADPNEISLVDRPCGPTSTFFEVHKKDGSVEKVDFVKPGAETVEKKDEKKTDDVEKVQLVRTDGVDLAVFVEKKLLPQPGQTFEFEGRTLSLVKMDEQGRAVVELVYEVTGSPEDIASFAKTIGERGLAIADVTKMIEPLPTNASIDAAVVEQAAAEKIVLKDATEDARKDLRKRVSDRLRAEVEKRAAQPAEKKFADSKNKRFPLDTADHVKASWLYVNMPHVTKTYKAEEIAAMRDLISTTAKALNVELEDTTKVDAAVVQKRLRKGLATCGQFAYMLDSLCQLAEAIELEAMAEGDGSTICDDIYVHITALGQCLADLVAEEVREEAEGTEKDEAAHGHLLAMKERVTTMVKNYTAVRVSRVQKLHDMATGMGAKCATAEKAADTTITKSDQPAADGSIVLKIDGKDVSLQKLIDDTVEKRVEPVQKALDAERAKIAKLEAQPMPTKVQLALLGQAKAVSKTDDGNAEDDGSPAFAPVLDSFGKVNVVATVIKAQQMFGARAAEVLKRYVDTDTGIAK